MIKVLYIYYQKNQSFGLCNFESDFLYFSTMYISYSQIVECILGYTEVQYLDYVVNHPVDASFTIKLWNRQNTHERENRL